ncbi:hypothetical protein ESCO_002288 [Escovopsis weberi]|uniref:Uncharacterized protein n=1 Tax=Escovopsis weberi TaxID=150374 RepID=A0A0M8N8B1_ESCWE|nr:hypothetical protein ESCO_002288 [Escovopsis weberi]
MPNPDHHCSKCFRKAPSKPHKRARSPLGLKNEIEMHSDKARCCRIRRGLGSADNLPNRSGWIPASLLPKTLTALRKDVVRKYPAYARTIYPLHEANRNGSYWRSDPNNDDNKKWWDIPWPPYRDKAPFPNWVAPDAPEDEAQAARRRQDFMLKPVPDPTYRYQTDEEVDEDAKDVVPEEDPAAAGTNKRKRARSDQPQAEKTAPPADSSNATNAADGANAADAAAPDGGEEGRPAKKTKRAVKAKKAPAKRRKTARK